MRSQWDHSWGVVSDGHVVCRSGGDTQGVAAFATAARLTDHHDEQLSTLTEQINQLFEENQAHPDGRHLAFLQTPDGVLLAWTRNEHDKSWADQDMASRSDLVTADSDEDLVRERLGLR